MTTTSDIAERYLSRAEVLDKTGVTYPTLWQWMREGNFPRARELGRAAKSAGFLRRWKPG